MSTRKWQYFGLSGAKGIYEIYRRPYSDEKISIADVNKLERLRKNGEWINDPDDRAVFDEMRSGWFDFNDEISEEQMKQLVEEWKKTRWPGRP